MIATRLSPGAISESSSSHLPPSEGSYAPKPVIFPPGWLRCCDDAAGDGIGHIRKDDRDRPRLPLEGNGRRGPACHDDVGMQADQLLRERSYPIAVIAGPTKVDPRVAAIGPTQGRKRLAHVRSVPGSDRFRRHPALPRPLPRRAPRHSAIGRPLSSRHSTILESASAPPAAEMDPSSGEGGVRSAGQRCYSLRGLTPSPRQKRPPLPEWLISTVPAPIHHRSRS